MHYYYLEHECSLCFVKGYSIPLVIVSYHCRAKVSQSCQMSDMVAARQNEVSLLPSHCVPNISHRMPERERERERSELEREPLKNIYIYFSELQC